METSGSLYTAPKKSRKKNTTKVELSAKDQAILSMFKSGRPMDRICAQYSVHKSYVEKLVNDKL